jgi:hypothetical protein
MQNRSYRVGLETFQVVAVVAWKKPGIYMIRGCVMTHSEQVLVRYASGASHQLRMAGNLRLLRPLTSNVTTIRPSKLGVTSSQLHTPIWQPFNALALPLARFHESNVRGATKQECVKAPGLRPKQNQQDTPFECQNKV